MNGGYKEIVQETGNYQEILNTVVGSKVYYMFQEEVHKALKDTNDIELGNKIALDETLQFLWWEHLGLSKEHEALLGEEEGYACYLWDCVFKRLGNEGLKRPNFITSDTFEEFLEELKEMKLEKNG